MQWQWFDWYTVISGYIVLFSLPWICTPASVLLSDLITQDNTLTASISRPAFQTAEKCLTPQYKLKKGNVHRCLSMVQLNMLFEITWIHSLKSGLTLIAFRPFEINKNYASNIFIFSRRRDVWIPLMFCPITCLQYTHFIHS